MWDSRRRFTRDGFCRHVQSIASETYAGSRTPPITGRSYPPRWWVDGIVRVYWDRGISQETVGLVAVAMGERIAQVLDWEPTYELLGFPDDACEMVDRSRVRGRIDQQRLFETALTNPGRNRSLGGIQHADVFITSSSLLDDEISWGAASFKYGTIVFALHGARQWNRRYIEKVVFHETGHLLGCYSHCDDYLNVEGYPYDPSCNMHYSCEGRDLCPKCSEMLRSWWIQLAFERRRSLNE